MHPRARAIKKGADILVRPLSGCMYLARYLFQEVSRRPVFMTLRADDLLVILGHAPLMRLMAVAATGAIIIDMPAVHAYLGFPGMAFRAVLPVRPALVVRMVALITHELHGRFFLYLYL